MTYEQRVWLEGELKRKAELLSVLLRIRDPWSPGSSVAKLAEKLHDDVSAIAAELLKIG